jgi:hypothetical protein
MKMDRKQLFAARLTSFLLITLPSAGMYPAAQAGATGWIWLLIGLTSAGCVLAMATK